MPSSRTNRKFEEWQRALRRGQEKKTRGSKDPIGRAKLVACIQSPEPVKFHLQLADVQSALLPLPDYLVSTTTPALELPAEPLPAEPEPHHSFLKSFPAEIRNMIYTYAVDFPDVRTLSKALDKQICRPGSTPFTLCEDCYVPHWKIELHTPTILLLCKQITREAITVLRLSSFVFDRMPPWLMGHSLPLPITDLITRKTLQNLRFAEIRLSLADGRGVNSGSLWVQVLKPLFQAWSEKHSLVRLKVMIKVHSVNWRDRYYPELGDYERLINMIDTFEFNHSTKPQLVEYEHWVVDFDHAYSTEHRNPQIRKYPDPNIWAGNITEFL
ncbi:hypothetical protein F4778DRAFT_780819 [Xylariomycetidae sp. FL2044]|nr:hypothetical protein F4778DRAFT_780819 [Xylariomycetidae sp. FL2044]